MLPSSLNLAEFVTVSGALPSPRTININSSIQGAHFIIHDVSSPYARKEQT